MTISSTNPRWEYTGDGATKGFAYDNKIFATSQIKVYVDNVLKTLTTHYTVSGISPTTGGTVTFVTAPALNTSVILLSAVPDTQATGYPVGGSLPSGVIEDDIDRRTIVSQQQGDELDRAMLTPAGEPQIDMTLPVLATRLSKFLYFDASGQPTGSAGTSDGVIGVDVQAYDPTIVVDADIGVTIQAYDATLLSMAALGTAADKIAYTTGVDTWAEAAITTQGRQLIDDTTFAAMRTTLGLGTAAVADTGVANGNIPVMDGTGYPAADGSQITGIATVGVDVQSFTTAGADTWTKPSGVTKVLVEAWGGGASGGTRGSGNTGGGGGGGAYVYAWFDAADLGATETVTIAAGGIAVSSSGNGNIGGDTTFGAFLTSYGGGAGGGTDGNGGGGGGGSLSVGTTSTGSGGGSAGSPVGYGAAGGGIDIAGKASHFGGAGGGGGGGAGNVGGDSFYGGAGGGSGRSDSSGNSLAGGTSIYGGDGGAGSFDGSNGTAGTQPGGGGGGCETSGTSGAGADGKMIVTSW